MSASRHGRPLVFICAAGTAFLAGIAARGLGGVTVISNVHHADESATHPPTNERSIPGPATQTDGIPAGFARSSGGARAAAVAYVLTGQTLIGLPATAVGAAVRSIAASANATGQVQTTVRQLDELRSVLASGTGPTQYWQAALATRVGRFAPDRAQVSVWNVGVLSRIDVAAPQATWAISNFDLVWERGDWKVEHETIGPGPAPALNTNLAPATSEDLAVALVGFRPWTASP
jgi:hypothetical protein